MRLHPVIPMVVRRLIGPTTIGGVDLPAGADVAASILLAHRDPRNFPLPLIFRPERFVDGHVPPNTWLPFGGGVRRCIGAGFSLMEGVAVLREVLRPTTCAADGDDVPKVRNITSVPRHGARIVLTSRVVGRARNLGREVRAQARRRPARRRGLERRDLRPVHQGAGHDHEDRPTGYYVAHSVLIVVNVVIAVVLGRWGWQALKATRKG